jgi:hypothetical protein
MPTAYMKPLKKRSQNKKEAFKKAKCVKNVEI